MVNQEQGMVSRRWDTRPDRVQVPYSERVAEHMRFARESGFPALVIPKYSDFDPGNLDHIKACANAMYVYNSGCMEAVRMLVHHCNPSNVPRDAGLELALTLRQLDLQSGNDPVVMDALVKALHPKTLDDFNSFYSFMHKLAEAARQKTAPHED